MEKEIWKTILVSGIETNYSISSFGRVYNNKFKRFVKGTPDSNGYNSIKIKRKTHHVHVLVAKHFIGYKPCRKLRVVDHIDRNRLNNNLSNLRIVSQRENSIRRKGNSTSDYRGVHWNKKSRKWVAQINVNGKLIYLGGFDCELTASKTVENHIKMNKL